MTLLQQSRQVTKCERRFIYRAAPAVCNNLITQIYCRAIKNINRGSFV